MEVNIVGADRLIALYEIAAEENIFVEDFRLKSGKSMIINTEGQYAIALNSEKIRSSADERACLSHEIGHYKTHSLYNEYLYSIPGNIERDEFKARRWSYEHELPFEELQSAVDEGYVTTYDLSKRTGLPEYFVKGATEHYERMGLSLRRNTWVED